MVTVHPVAADQDGNITDTKVLDRLRELPGLGAGANPLEELSSPFYVAHRGGAFVVPEQSMEGYRIMDATGVDVLEADVQPTADGALVLMHDPTVDRTTDGAGLVSEYSLPSFLSLDAAADIPWPRVSPPATLQQFFSEFGGKRVLMIEPKNTATLHGMLDAAEAAGVKDSIMVETNSLTVAQDAVARGYTVWFFYGSTITSPSVQTLLDAGVQHLAASSGISDADVSTLVATGRPVTIYGVHRRIERDRYLALGVVGISSDNPTYVKADTAFQKRDSWSRGVWGHGLNSNRGNMPQIEDGALVLSVTASAPEIITVGEVAPIANAAGTYTIDLDLGWKTLPTDTAKPLNVYFCIPDDRAYTYAAWNTIGGLSDSYLASLKANGQLTLHKLDAATATTGGNISAAIATVNTPALTPGAFAHLRINVTPSGLTVTRTDTSSTPITSNDTEHRGGYLQLTRHSTADGVGLYRNLIIS